jgi:hypothetical protein
LPETDLTLTIPRRSSGLRLIALGSGGIVFLWTSLEDTNVLPVTLLGGGLALILLVLWVTGRFGGKTFAGRTAVMAAALIGAAWGLSAALAVALLMLVKNGLHGHLFPDYPFGMIAEILGRAPLWALAGIFAGIGALLAWWGNKRKL